MLGRTHEVAAVGAVASAAILFPVKDMTFETATLSLLTALVGGLTPDIDKQGSTIWDKMPAGGCLSRIVHPVFIGGHRHITHSFLGMFLFGIGMRALLTVLPFGPGISLLESSEKLQAAVINPLANNHRRPRFLYNNNWRYFAQRFRI